MTAESRPDGGIEAAPGELGGSTGEASENAPALTEERRTDLQASAINDAVLARLCRDGGREGWGLRWDDGSGSPFWLPVFDRDKRPRGRDGKPMKARFPSKADGGDRLGPNVLRRVPGGTRTLAVEGLR